MLTSILQTLAELLAGGTTLTSTEQIDFSHPADLKDRSAGPLLNLYLYDIRESKHQRSSKQVAGHIAESNCSNTIVACPANWFDVSILLTASDRTTLGGHHLLSEALSLLLRHHLLREEFLAPNLRGQGNLSLTVSLDPPIEIGGLWSALAVPLRPALYLTVAVPFEPQIPALWEQASGKQNAWQETQISNAIAKHIVIAGIVKNAVTTQSLAEVKVSLLGTEKAVISNSKGIFFFEDLNFGNYILQLSGPGYQVQNCNVLVDSSTYTFKEILLNPV
jgi:hypothetical protein